MSIAGDDDVVIAGNERHMSVDHVDSRRGCAQSADRSGHAGIEWTLLDALKQCCQHGLPGATASPSLRHTSR